MQRLLGLSEGVVDRYEQNTDRYEHKKRIPRDCDCPEITTAACSYLSTHRLFIVTCLSLGCCGEAPRSQWLTNNRHVSLTALEAEVQDGASVSGL